MWIRPGEDPKAYEEYKAEKPQFELNAVTFAASLVLSGAVIVILLVMAAIAVTALRIIF